MTSFESIKEELSLRLSGHRFQHTLSVIETAEKIALAIKNQYPELNQDYLNKIKLAALLHDCCKEVPNADMIQLANFYGLETDLADEHFPNLLHARVGAKYAEDHFEILDPFILKAIEQHTLGAPNMFLSAKILFLADMIEPSRDLDLTQPSYLSPIRELIYDKQALDKALLKAMNSKLNHTISKNQLVHPLSIEARNYLIAVID
ncbi:MAG: bis(5'-nucleosyl)-tetraphosphatase (symmetrical) YqeK [Candidatus Caenarcaniphilales bacterium]|jgi:predicted HD superfamily hydrolase involved in NAD metabolism|nr:bis(5'-nucleosyl)-tetraphosphatase (symmetrical) YqeK [Candidatus Caenarcaniphilales bacterium]